MVLIIHSSALIGPFMHAQPDGCELCPNLEFLGRSGVKEFEDGFRIAFLSGKDNDLYEKSTGVSIRVNNKFRLRKLRRDSILAIILEKVIYRECRMSMQS